MRRSDTLSRTKDSWRFAARIAWLSIILGGSVQAGDLAALSADNTPVSASERNAAARRWFEEARFGLSFQWGVHSLLAKGEGVMDRDQLSVREYAKLPPRFNPAKFDADAWVKLAKSAGARYMTVTSKNHDGFCMFASQLTDYDVVDATPYRKDPLKGLVDACHDQNIKIFFAYSLLDWHHPDYFPLGKTGKTTGRGVGGDWKRYVAYYQGQIRELCTNYGEIGGISFDGAWDRPDTDWDLASTYRLIHKLQPGALVGNSHHGSPTPGEDFQITEKDLPGENKPGINKAGPVANFPLETCVSINNSWGYNAADTGYKSAEQIVQTLIESAGRGSNLLLSVGPRPDGSIEVESRQRLVDVGKWLTTYGDTVYGTRQGPISPQPWGVSTVKGSRDHPAEIYLHILKPDPHSPIILNGTTASWTPHLFGNGRPLKTTRSPRGLTISLSDDAFTPIDTIVVMKPAPIGE